jgi:hypothetical protein
MEECGEEAGRIFFQHVRAAALVHGRCPGEELGEVHPDHPRGKKTDRGEDGETSTDIGRDLECGDPPLPRELP